MPPYVITPDATDPLVIGESAKYRPAISAAWERSDALPRVTHLQGGRVRNAIPAAAEATVAGLTAAQVQPLADGWSEKTEVAFTLTDTPDGLHIAAHGRGAHIGKPWLGRNAQTALTGLLADLPLADCGSTRAVGSLARLFPWNDPHGAALGLTVEDEVMGKCRVNATTCTLTEEGVVCQFDSRGGANATEENYARVIDAALQAEGFAMEQSEMDAAHYVPPTAKIVEDMAALYRQVRGIEPAIVSQVAGSYAHFVDGAIAVGRAAPGVDCRIHKADEWLPLADFDRLVELLALSMLRFCGKE
jgi:succinyl-diaminopimelate desuccinylase